MQTLRYLTMTIVSILGSSPSLGGEILLAPIANDDATIKSGHARFTILTPEMIRMEWSPSNSFEDRALLHLHQSQPLKVPKYNIAATVNGSSSPPNALTLATHDGQPFRDGNLSITFKLNGQSVEWKPGMDEWATCGTTRTLDGVSGRVPARKGILSRDGWSVVDDSTRTAVRQRSAPLGRTTQRRQRARTGTFSDTVTTTNKPSKTTRKSPAASCPLA
ncbi:MAG: hypothetical protein R3E58_11515 [Phycisphaerae bacterium]